jgi:hypothetical protein
VSVATSLVCCCLSELELCLPLLLTLASKAANL